MVSMGVTRKIDTLGRIVIPKEIRERLNIKENDYLEFLVFNDGLALKKYSKIGKLQYLAQELTDTLNMFLNAEVLIADRDKVLAYTGDNKDKYLNKNIGIKLLKAINRREAIFEPYFKDIEILDNDVINCSYIDETIVSNSEEAGIIILFHTDKPVTETELKIVKIVSSFLTKYLEE